MINTYLKTFCLIGALTTVWGCSKKSVSKEKSPPPATVQNSVKETDLTTISLTSQAEARLGIQTVAVEYRSVEKSRTFGGEIMSVSGRSVSVSAPMSGTLLAAENGMSIKAGQQVTKSQPLYRLLLALPEQNLLSVQEEISIQEVELDLARAKVKRARQLLDDKAGSARGLEDAQAQLARVSVALETAQTRMKLLESGQLDSATEELSSLVIKSPMDGIIQNVHTATGQTVTATTGLLDIASIDPVWIKVPVYVGDMATIDTKKPARVHSLADFAGIEATTAEPVVASFSADPESATSDLFYEISNADLTYRPGQKVSVTLPLKDTEQNLVVPYS
jgi:cobalt-zinc-cadmium efflux system membrane fusion protein